MARRMIQNIPVEKTIPGGYLLRLGNGQGWQLESTVGAKTEVEKLGRIMGLKSYEPNGYPKLIFIRRQSGKTKCEEPTFGLDEDTKEYLRKPGWIARDLMLLRLWSHDDAPDLICEMRHEEDNYEQSILSMRFSLYPIYQRAQESGGIPLHAGLVERGGKGILLAGPKNTGKSTCCLRLPSPWRSFCDEETLIVMDKQQEYQAHPFPTWSDFFRKSSLGTWNVERHLPFSAIFFLEQAEQDEVIRIGPGEAAVLMNQSAMQVYHRFWHYCSDDEVKKGKKKLFENACQLTKSVPAFKLRVSLNGRFWEKIETVLT